MMSAMGVFRDSAVARSCNCSCFVSGWAGCWIVNRLRMVRVAVLCLIGVVINCISYTPSISRAEAYRLHMYIHTPSPIHTRTYPRQPPPLIPPHSPSPIITRTSTDLSHPHSPLHIPHRPSIHTPTLPTSVTPTLSLHLPHRRSTHTHTYPPQPRTRPPPLRLRPPLIRGW